MFGIRKNGYYAWKDMPKDIFGDLVRIVTFSRWTFLPRSIIQTKGFQRTHKFAPYWKHWLGDWVCLLNDLVVLFSFAYLDADWTERYWGIRESTSSETVKVL